MIFKGVWSVNAAHKHKTNFQGSPGIVASWAPPETGITQDELDYFLPLSCSTSPPSQALPYILFYRAFKQASGSESSLQPPEVVSVAPT